MFEMLHMVRQGGWTMLPLGICSVVALTIIIERAMALRRNRVIDPVTLRIIEDYEGEASAPAALIACQRCAGAFAEILAEVIRNRRLDHAQAVESLRAVGRTQVGRLERGLTVLEIVAGISPLLGLLGTVLGLVQVFDAITARGLGDPQVLSAGISKALVTTVAGLMIAIPSLAFHSLFNKRVDELATEMQDRATAFLVKLQQYQGQ